MIETYSQAIKESITVSILSRDGQMPVNLISTAEVIFCCWWISHCFTASFIDMAFHIVKKFQKPAGHTTPALRALNLFNQSGRRGRWVYRKDCTGIQ